MRDPTLGIIYLFHFSLPSEGVVVSCCGFNLYFPDYSDIETFYKWLSAIQVSSLVKSLFTSFAHLFIVCHLVTEFVRVPFMFWTQVFCQMGILQVCTVSLCHAFLIS